MPRKWAIALYTPYWRSPLFRIMQAFETFVGLLVVHNLIQMSSSKSRHSSSMLGDQPISRSDLFSLEIDHVVIYTADSISAIEPLKKLGFYVHPPVHYPDYGTVSTLIFFENIYLEIVGIENECAVRQQATLTGFNPLTRVQGQRNLTSPFGVGLRYKPNSATSINPIAPSRESELKRESDMSVYFDADNIAKPDEPFCFIVSNTVALTTRLHPLFPYYQQWSAHRLNIQRVTDIRITVHAFSKMSKVIALLDQNHVLRINQGLFPSLELTFDGGITGKTIDVHPFLPLVLKY